MMNIAKQAMTNIGIRSFGCVSMFRSYAPQQAE
jgi:hypothetical protein